MNYIFKGRTLLYLGWCRGQPSQYPSRLFAAFPPSKTHLEFNTIPTFIFGVSKKQAIEAIWYQSYLWPARWRSHWCSLPRVLRLGAVLCPVCVGKIELYWISTQDTILFLFCLKFKLSATVSMILDSHPPFRPSTVVYVNGVRLKLVALVRH